MVSLKVCPNCGTVINDEEVEFCTECGCNLTHPTKQVSEESSTFFDNLVEKTSFPIIVFSFIIFGVFLFVGSIFWSLWGSIDLITYVLLVVVFAVFFGGIFVGYYGCKDKSFILPNFFMYLGSMFAVVLCVFGLLFTFVMRIFSSLSSLSSGSPSASSYPSSYQTPSYAPSVDLSFAFKIILFILLIPVAAYFGVHVGYILRENI